VDPRLKKLGELARKLGWDRPRNRSWLEELFGVLDPMGLKPAELDDAVTLLDLLCNSGQAAYDSERASLAELGRVKGAR
jgi:hypothetical protein